MWICIYSIWGPSWECACRPNARGHINTWGSCAHICCHSLPSATKHMPVPPFRVPAMNMFYLNFRYGRGAPRIPALRSSKCTASSRTLTRTRCSTSYTIPITGRNGTSTCWPQLRLVTWIQTTISAIMPVILHCSLFERVLNDFFGSVMSGAGQEPRFRPTTVLARYGRWKAHFQPFGAPQRLRAEERLYQSDFLSDGLCGAHNEHERMLSRLHFANGSQRKVAAVVGE